MDISRETWVKNYPNFTSDEKLFYIFKMLYADEINLEQAFRLCEKHKIFSQCAVTTELNIYNKLQET